MSDLYTGRDPTSGEARAYNKRMAFQLGWPLALKSVIRAQGAQGMSRRLARLSKVDPGSVLAVRLIREEQRARGLRVDGRLGRATWRKIRVDISEVVFDPFRAVDIAGLRVPLRCGMDGAPSYIVNNNSERLDEPLHYRRGRTGEPRHIFLHWGGFDVSSCASALAARRLSTAFLIAPMLEGGRLVIYQAVDLADTALHIGRYNDTSVGIDVCRSPLMKFRDRYEPDVPIQDYRSRRYPQVVGWTDDYGAAVHQFVCDLARVLGIPEPTVDPGGPRSQAIKGATPANLASGVYGHHHVTRNRWDIRPHAHHIYRQ